MSDIETRASDAAAMLENPLFNEALDHLRKESVDAWVATKSDQAAERDRLWTMVKMIDRMRGYFETIRDEGRFAANRVTRAPLP
jgi:hypothetical protein